MVSASGHYGVPMSALGHKRTLRCVATMSALPPKADIAPAFIDVRQVSIADMTKMSVKCQ
jgi:hypothetical protein